MLDLAFYTYFYGTDNNVAFKIPEIPSLKYNCYYYTNNKKMYELLKTTKWIPIYHENQSDDDMIENNMMGKFIKSSPHKFKELKNYSYLCFLDSKLEKLNIFFIEYLIVKNFINNNYAFLLREHWFLRENVWNEFNESMKEHRYFLEKDKYINYINNQIENGLSEKTKNHYATGLLIRNMKHKNINDINDKWYEHILECGIQCQISFFFVKQFFQNDILSFTEIPFYNDKDFYINIYYKLYLFFSFIINFFRFFTSI